MLPCDGCAYRQSIPGARHARCSFDWMRHDLKGMVALIGSAKITPRTAQWFRFPFNYDPIWGPDACPQRTETADDEKRAAPNLWADLLSLLR